ncbi:MAG: response regulator transcription factor [Streptosporangiaceae bacterium]
MGEKVESEPVSVLLAEHEPEVAEMSARYLRRDGLRVRLVTTPEQALAELTGGPDAAAVLDLTMPGLDSRRIRRALRTPVIFLVAGPQGPRPRGLARSGGTTGPRRWLARPFGPRQLVALVRDVLAAPAPSPAQGAEPAGARSRGGPAGAGRAACGLRLDGRTLWVRTAAAGGQPVKLTATEFAVLAALLDHPGRVLSRRQLLAAAGHPAAADRAADVYISQLRAKIGPAVVIRTARGTGYAIDP